VHRLPRRGGRYVYLWDVYCMLTLLSGVSSEKSRTANIGIVRGWFRSTRVARATLQKEHAARGFGSHGTVRQEDQDGHSIQPPPEGQPSRTKGKDSTAIKAR
jgi:hypothetical protein